MGARGPWASRGPWTPGSMGASPPRKAAVGNRRQWAPVQGGPSASKGRAPDASLARRSLRR
eukprot:5400575-Prymnesium_polylepis.1